MDVDLDLENLGFKVFACKFKFSFFFFYFSIKIDNEIFSKKLVCIVKRKKKIISVLFHF